jgi:hypothetical protein
MVIVILDTSEMLVFSGTNHNKFDRKGCINRRLCCKFQFFFVATNLV